ncbi:MAG TPA: transglutaminase domain-containing protein, partial [Candidatus Dormibacteraeota bacterium]|nr:transglutaminase domain-containing protein [Candidatus Dormibacteraeota bacterium]
EGYCQYFATAMADMLRSLGIPARLVNGYGPGTYDQRLQRFVVRESDAHTWPEAYFPGYGWIAFEPTPDGVYFPLQRGAGGGAPCTGDACSTAPAAGALSSPAARPAPVRAERTPAGGVAGRLPSLVWATSWTGPAAILLLLCVLAAVALSRYLRPGTPAGVWRRTTLLVRLTGVRLRPGETPIEFGDRVAGEFPEAAPHVRRLASDFAAAAYGPPGLAEQRTPAVLADWTALRPLLLRRIASRRWVRHDRGLRSAEPV